MAKTAFLLVLTITSVLGLGVQERRSFFQTASAGLAFVLTPNANAILSSKYCASGVGEGCEDRSEGNDFIKALQEKSALNREQNMKVSGVIHLHVFKTRRI
jgi:hypothetical protein